MCYNEFEGDIMHKEHILIPHYQRRIPVTYCYPDLIYTPLSGILILIDSQDTDSEMIVEMTESFCGLGHLVCLYDIRLQDDISLVKSDFLKEIKTILTDMMIQPDCNHHAISMIACDQPAGWLLLDVFDDKSVKKITLFNPTVCDTDKPTWLNTWRMPLLLIHENPAWITTLQLRPNPHHIIAVDPKDPIQMIIDWHKSD
jgi:hypothetical protein